MDKEIAALAMRFATVCFVLYVILVLVPIFSKPKDAAGSDDEGTKRGLSGAEVSAMVNAVATLAEALAKAGPALWSLIGSILFLLIAGMASGIFGP